MPGTLALSVRKAVAKDFGTYVRAQTGFSAVATAYSWTPAFGERNREKVFTRGGDEADQETAALRSGRRYRDELKDFDVVIVSELPGKSPEVVADRVVAVGAHFEEWLADRASGQTLGLVGLNWITVIGADGPFEAAGRDGSIAELTYRVRYRARLT